MQANYPPPQKKNTHTTQQQTHTHPHTQNNNKKQQQQQHWTNNKNHPKISQKSVSHNYYFEMKPNLPAEREREREREKNENTKKNWKSKPTNERHKTSYLQVKKKHKTTATNKNILLCHFRTTTLTVLHPPLTSCADRLATPQALTLLGIWPHTLLFKLLVTACSCLVISCEKNCCPFSFICSFLEKSSHFILSKTDLFGDWHSISFFFTACQNNLDKCWEIKTTFAHHCTPLLADQKAKPTRFKFWTSFLLHSG